MSKEELRRLQYDIVRGEELIVEWDTVGVKEVVSRVGAGVWGEGWDEVAVLEGVAGWELGEVGGDF